MDAAEKDISILDPVADIRRGNAWSDGKLVKILPSDSLESTDSLKIDSFKSSELWNPCYKSKPGLLKGGKTYSISFKCKNLELGEDSFTLFLVRPFDAGNALSDVGQATDNDSGEKAPQSLTIRCQIPSGRDDYSFQIHTRKQVKAIIGEICVKECEPERVLPLTGPAPASDKIQIPSGAKEFSVDQPKPLHIFELKAETFGVSTENADNVKALNDAIAKCQNLGASKLSLPKGIYHFNSDTPLTFKNLRDFEFDGNGSTFVFLKKKNSLIEISDCERVLFKRFNVDWDWDKDPLASVVKVENIEEDGAYADFRFVDYDIFPNPDTRFALLDMMDPATMSVSSEGGFSVSLEFFKGKNKPETQWLSGNLLRIKSGKDNKSVFKEKLRKGQIFRLSHYYYDMVGVAMKDNAHLTLQDVNIYSCPSHAFLASGDQHHWQLIRSNIIRPPGTKRPITCTADHHHIAQSKGFLKLEGCEFSLGNDDCLNIHDCSAYGVKTAENTMSFNNMGGTSSYHPGDLIELRNEDYSPTGFKSKLSSAKHISGKNSELTFEDALPGKIDTHFVIFNLRYESRNIIVRNCFFHDNRARGLLLLGRDITVENNRFLRNQMGAIKIETGYTLNIWCEGYGASNIVIRNNSFDSVNQRDAFPNEKYPAIYMSVYLKTDPSTLKTSYPILSDILVEGNKFLNCPGVIAYACSAKNVMIRDNTIENPSPRLLAHPFRGAVATANSSEIFVTGNTWLRSQYMPNLGLQVDPESVKDAYCWNNKLADKGK